MPRVILRGESPRSKRILDHPCTADLAADLYMYPAHKPAASTAAWNDRISFPSHGNELRHAKYRQYFSNDYMMGAMIRGEVAKDPAKRTVRMQKNKRYHDARDPNCCDAGKEGGWEPRAGIMASLTSRMEHEVHRHAPIIIPPPHAVFPRLMQRELRRRPPPLNVNTVSPRNYLKKQSYKTFSPRMADKIGTAFMYPPPRLPVPARGLRAATSHQLREQASGTLDVSCGYWRSMSRQSRRLLRQEERQERPTGAQTSRACRKEKAQLHGLPHGAPPSTAGAEGKRPAPPAPQWNGRFQVMSSRGNASAHSNYREYFDVARALDS